MPAATSRLDRVAPALARSGCRAARHVRRHQLLWYIALVAALSVVAQTCVGGRIGWG